MGRPGSLGYKIDEGGPSFCLFKPCVSNEYLAWTRQASLSMGGVRNIKFSIKISGGGVGI